MWRNNSSACSGGGGGDGSSSIDDRPTCCNVKVASNFKFSPNCASSCRCNNRLGSQCNHSTLALIGQPHWPTSDATNLRAAEYPRRQQAAVESMAKVIKWQSETTGEASAESERATKGATATATAIAKATPQANRSSGQTSAKITPTPTTTTTTEAAVLVVDTNLNRLLVRKTPAPREDAGHKSKHLDKTEESSTRSGKECDFRDQNKMELYMNRESSQRVDSSTRVSESEDVDSFAINTFKQSGATSAKENAASRDKCPLIEARQATHLLPSPPVEVEPQEEEEEATTRCSSNNRTTSRESWHQNTRAQAPTALNDSLASLKTAQLILIYTLITSATVLHQPTTFLQAQSIASYWPPQHQHQHHHRQRPPPVPFSPSLPLTLAPKPSSTALAPSGDPAMRRKLLIGQHYTNFSSVVPYSIEQDADYATGQEDPIVNEAEFAEEQQQRQATLNQRQQPAGAQHQQHQQQQQQQQLQQDANKWHQWQERHESALENRPASPEISDKNEAIARALLPLDSNRLILPQMQQIKSRFNQGCVGGTKCQFFAFCWMSGGSLGASCGLLMTCCVTPSRQEIQPGFYGPVVNDPYCGRSTSKINRIVGGTDASFGQFPWQAFVQVGGSRCGGALISSRHVVTAGHCVARSQHSPSSIKVTLGDYILNSDIESIPHEVFSVVEVLLHPNFRFTPQADRYDVAVLELDRAATYKDNIKPICLPQKDANFVGRVAYVAGWGALQAGSKLRPKVLQHVAVPVIENHVCEGWHRRKGIDIRIYDEMMCAGYELGQRDACQGDSGGPLMLNQFGVWYLVGIVSAGYSCAKQYQPGIYHRVSSSSDWISSNVYQQGASK